MATTVIELGQRVKAKYPGVYDDIPDADVGQRIKAKYPGDYDDFVDAPPAAAMPAVVPGAEKTGLPGLPPLPLPQELRAPAPIIPAPAPQPVRYGNVEILAEQPPASPTLIKTADVYTRAPGTQSYISKPSPLPGGAQGPLPPVETRRVVEGPPQTFGEGVEQAVGYTARQLPKVAIVAGTNAARLPGQEPVIPPETARQVLQEPIVKPSLLIPEGDKPDAIRGLVKGTVEGIEGLSSPENIAILAGTGALGSAAAVSPPMVRAAWKTASTALTAYFTKQLGTGAYEAGKASVEALNAGDYEAAARNLGLAGTQGLFALLGAAHATKTTTEAVRGVRLGYEGGKNLAEAQLRQEKEARGSGPGYEPPPDAPVVNVKPEPVPPAAPAGGGAAATPPIDIEAVYPKFAEWAEKQPVFGRKKVADQFGITLEQAQQLADRAQAEGRLAPRKQAPNGSPQWGRVRAPGKVVKGSVVKESGLLPQEAQTPEATVPAAQAAPVVPAPVQPQATPAQVQPAAPAAQEAQAEELPAPVAIDAKPAELSVPEARAAAPTTEGIAAKIESQDGGITRFAYLDGDGNRIGSASLSGDLMLQLQVDPAFQRKGYGKQILSDLESRGGRVAHAGTEQGGQLLKSAGYHPSATNPSEFVKLEPPPAAKPEASTAAELPAPAPLPEAQPDVPSVRTDLEPSPAQVAAPAPPAEAETPTAPSYKEGDRGSYVNSKGQKLTGTVRGVDQQRYDEATKKWVPAEDGGLVDVKVDQIAHAGGVPIGRLERWPVSKVQRIEAEPAAELPAPVPLETKAAEAETKPVQAETDLPAPEPIEAQAEELPAPEPIEKPAAPPAVLAKGVAPEPERSTIPADAGNANVEKRAEVNMFEAASPGDALKAAFGFAEAAGEPQAAADTGVVLGSGLGALPHVGVGEFVKQDVGPGLTKAAKIVGSSVDAIRRSFAPQTRGAPAKQMALSIREHAADLAQKQDRAQHALRTARDYFASRTPQENWDFVDAVESGTRQASPELQEMADTVRELLDGRREEVQNLGTGKLETFIEDYFPHIWKDPASARDVFLQMLGRRPLQGSKSFLKHRTIPTLADGMAWRVNSAAGEFLESFPTEVAAQAFSAAHEGSTIGKPLEPVSGNAIDLAILKLREMDKYVMAQRIFDEMKTSGIVQFVRAGEKPPEGYAPIDDNIATVYGPRKGAVGLPNQANIQPEDVSVYGQRIMGKYYAMEAAAKVINNHLSPGLQGNAAFQAFRSAGNTLNQFQLGWSGFHLGFTSVDAAVSRLALGFRQAAQGQPIRGIATAASTPAAPITNILKGDKVMREWFNPGTESSDIAEAVAAMKQGGGRARMDAFYRTNMRQRMMDAFRKGNVIGGLLRLPGAATEKVASYILEEVVPRQKMGVFFDMAQNELRRLGPDVTLGQRRAAFSEAWDSVDNRMGQLVYDNLFWNRAAKDLAMASVRSVGWNLGTIRELGGGLLIDTPKAAAKLATGKRPDFTYRMSYVLALPIVAGISGAMLQYLMTGKGPGELKDYFFPKNGNTDEHGRPERMSLPSYMKDVYHYSKDPIGTAAAKQQPLLSILAEMLRNQDYYGVRIRNEDDPFLRQLLDVAKHAVKSFEPFSVRGFQRESTLGGNTMKKVLPFVGVIPAPVSLNRTAAEELAGKYVSEKMPQGSRTEQQYARSQAIGAIMREIRMKHPPGAKIKEAIDAGLISRKELSAIRKRAALSPLERQFSSLTLAEAVNVYQKANAEERSHLLKMLRRKASNAFDKPSQFTPKVREKLGQWGIRSPRKSAAQELQPVAAID